LNSVVDKPVEESDGALRNSARWLCVEGNPEVAAATVHQFAGYGWVQPIFSRGGSLAVAARPDSHNGDPSPTETTGQLALSGSLLVMFSFTSP
jgi:hypothetical protein